MGRQMLPENRALMDRIAEVLADAWPELLSSSEVAERVGGVKTLWEVCRRGQTYVGYDGKEHEWPCRVDRPHPYRHDGHDFNPRHHDGPVAQDSWEVPYSSQDMNPMLNRLARDGMAEKIKVRALRGVLWRWSGDTDERDSLVADLERLLTGGEE